MPTWLQLLIVYTLVTGCLVYSVTTLLPRGARAGTALALARLLNRRHGGRWDRLAPLHSALQAYARRHGNGAGCGGCGSCAAPHGPTGSGPLPAEQPVHWQARPRHQGQCPAQIAGPTPDSP